MENLIKQKISESASKIANNAIENIARRLPNDAAKKNFIARIKNILAEGIDGTINGQEYQKYLERGAYEFTGKLNSAGAAVVQKIKICAKIQICLQMNWLFKLQIILVRYLTAKKV